MFSLIDKLAIIFDLYTFCSRTSIGVKKLFLCTIRCYMSIRLYDRGYVSHVRMAYGGKIPLLLLTII